MANNSGKLPAFIVSHRECLHNFSPHQGHHISDRCPNFVKGGDERTPEALYCATSCCHRNYHRREEVPVEVEPWVDNFLHRMAVTPAPHPHLPILGAHHHHPVAPGAPPPPSEENLGDSKIIEEPARQPEPRRRERTRTRLTPQQKDAMGIYAERLGWSLQGYNDEELVEFCSAVAITPQVFKAWIKKNRRRYSIY